MKTAKYWCYAGGCYLLLVFGTAYFNGQLLAQKAKPLDKSSAWRRIDQSQYVGSNKCAECHKEYFDSWKKTQHAKMIQPPIASGPNRTIDADFSKPNEYRNFELNDLKGVIGSRWKQRFIGEIDGKQVVFPAQWSVRDKVWQAYGGRSDWWYPYHPDWKKRSVFKLCDGCHTTGADHYTQSWTELNISCESCHGPGRAHSEDSLITSIVNPARLELERSQEVCLSCHLAGKPPGTEYAWPVGYQAGMVLGDFWQGFKPQKGNQTAEFWKNSTAHKNRVQGNTFLQSGMAHEGIQCSSCHDSHGSRHRSMTIKSAGTNALCLTCHGPEKNIGPDYAKLSDHTHHSATSTGSRCIECHMTRTGKNAVHGESRNHTFDFISPADTIKYGEDLPNSCNNCHSDKDAEWALDLVEKWY